MYAGAALALVGTVPALLARSAVPKIEGKPRARLLHFLRIAPSLLITALLFGLVESSVFSLMPVYGVDIGLQTGGVEGRPVEANRGFSLRVLVRDQARQPFLGQVRRERRQQQKQGFEVRRQDRRRLSSMAPSSSNLC